MSLQRALLLLIAIALLAGTIPAGLTLDRRMRAELEDRARDDLALAPRILADRSRGIAEALVMHAKDVARVPGLADAVVSGDRARGARIVEAARDSFGDKAILVDSGGNSWAGPQPDSALLAAVLSLKPSFGTAAGGRTLYMAALAPVQRGTAVIAAAGIAIALDSAAAGMLAGLTHSDVVILDRAGQLSAFSTAPGIADGIAQAARGPGAPGTVVDRQVGDARYLMVHAPLGSADVVFARALSRELAVMPTLRKMIILASLGSLVIALVLAALVAHRLTRPVSALATAADRLTEGDFDAPLGRSSLREIDRLAKAFDTMRRALRGRLEDLRDANVELGDRQQRLMSLQTELILRERQSASSRLVAELAHEIRNPVASMRNLLELVHRRVEHDPEALGFTNMAIDELLRMHELAERMLDLNRPSASSEEMCDVVSVARDVVAFTRLGFPADSMLVNISCQGDTHAAIAPDTLKQVLINLVQNAREAADGRLEISIDVGCSDHIVTVDLTDNGPGIPLDVLPRIFDPFFTTKGTAGGIGLGLFLAEGLVRKQGGRIVATNRPNGAGARFLVELPEAGEME